MIEITCKCGCGRKKMVRNADIRRGWGKYYSKSCKAVDQERRTGQYARYRIRGLFDNYDPGDSEYWNNKDF